MSVVPKKLTIVNDGGIYDISSNEEFKDLLESLETKYLENVETGRRVIGFLSLVDGASYRAKTNITSVVSMEDDEKSNDKQELQGDGGELQTQMAISDQDGDSSHGIETNNKYTIKSTPKRNAAIPKAIVVRRASVTKRRARDSLEQRKHHQVEKKLKKQLEIATSLAKAGNELAKQGKYANAMKSYRRVLKIRLKVLGKHHPNVASAFRNVGSILYAEGSYEEAMGMYQWALKIQVAAHGNNHPDVGQLCYNMGKALHQQGKDNEARKAYEKAQSIYLEIHGEDHAKIAEIRKSMRQVKNRQKAQA